MAIDDSSADLRRSLVEEAIVTRRSIRGFLPTPVPRETIERILEVAARAPSGSNIQPWKVHVVTGPALDRLKAALCALHDAETPERREYHYYPVDWRQPYLDRRRKVGWDLYALAGVGKGDREGSARQRGLNYRLFGAPVGLWFTIDRDLGQGSWLDYGMFLENIMIAARAHDLHTCPQAALANYPDVVRRELAIADDELVLCGMGLGHADPEDPLNRLVTERAPVAEFTRFHEY